MSINSDSTFYGAANMLDDNIPSEAKERTDVLPFNGKWVKIIGMTSEQISDVLKTGNLCSNIAQMAMRKTGRERTGKDMRITNLLTQSQAEDIAGSL